MKMAPLMLVCRSDSKVGDCVIRVARDEFPAERIFLFWAQGDPGVGLFENLLDDPSWIHVLYGHFGIPREQVLHSEPVNELRDLTGLLPCCFIREVQRYARESRIKDPEFISEGSGHEAILSI